MEDSKKNDVHIKRAENIRNSIKEIRKKAGSEFNNREFSLIVTKLQEAEMWVDEYIKTLQ